jgi:hypothetical protein
VLADPFGCRCLSNRPCLRFQIPLIKPDVQISRIRLSDKGSVSSSPTAVPSLEPTTLSTAAEPLLGLLDSPSVPRLLLLPVLPLNQGPFAPRSLLVSWLLRTSPPPDTAWPDPRGSPVGGAPHRAGLPVLTPCSFARIPSSIPRCLRSVLALLASQSNRGLHLNYTG